MGLGNNQPGGESPRTALFATGTPQELEELGVNPAEKPSCCVPVDGELQGCPHATNCHKLFGRGRFKAVNADFGPKSAKPGSVGQGAEYVGYYLETTEGDAKEDFMRCSAFMASIYPRIMAMNDPTEPSGEVIRILGGPGTKLRVFETLPEEPGSKKNFKMVTTEKVVEVPVHPRPKAVDSAGLVRQSARMREAAADERFADLIGTSSAADEPVTHRVTNAGTEPVVSEPKAVKRRE